MGHAGSDAVLDRGHETLGPGHVVVDGERSALAVGHSDRALLRLQDRLHDPVGGRVERFQHAPAAVEAEDRRPVDVEQLATALGGHACQLVGVEDAAGSDRQRVQCLEDLRLLLPLGAQRGRLDRGRHLGRQEEQDVAQLGSEETRLTGAHEEAAEDFVADLQRHPDHARNAAVDRPLEGVLPAGVVVNHDHLAGEPDLAADSLAGFQVLRGEGFGVVVGEDLDHFALEPDQGRAPAADHVACVVGDHPRQLDRVEHAAGGERDLVEDPGHASLSRDLVRPRGSRAHQAHDVRTY